MTIIGLRNILKKGKGTARIFPISRTGSSLAVTVEDKIGNNNSIKTKIPTNFLFIFFFPQYFTSTVGYLNVLDGVSL
jgi:hypothetical protein